MYSRGAKMKMALLLLLPMLIFPLLVFSEDMAEKESDFPNGNILEVSKKDGHFIYVLNGREDSYDECLKIIRRSCLWMRKNRKQSLSLCSIILDKRMVSEEILKLIRDLRKCGVEKFELLTNKNTDLRVYLKIAHEIPRFKKKEKAIKK
jgi:hypothetical protein